MYEVLSGLCMWRCFVSVMDLGYGTVRHLNLAVGNKVRLNGCSARCYEIA